MLSSFALLRQSDADIVDQPLGAQLRPVNGEMVVGIKKVLPVQDVLDKVFALEAWRKDYMYDWFLQIVAGAYEKKTRAPLSSMRP